MPLPQQVIEQMGRETVKTPGWSSGILFFSGSIFALILAIYLGITFVYEPTINNSINQAKSQIALLSQSISSADQADLIEYYSQVSNLKTLVANHVVFSNFFAWLEQNTEANVYYGSLSFQTGNQVTLDVFAKTQADVNQQLSIFENSSQVTSAAVSNIGFSAAAQMWAFNVTLTVNPSLLTWQPMTGTSAAVSSTISASALLPVATTTATTTASVAATTTSE